MSQDTASSSVPVPSTRPRVDLFLISVLILFLELACIRWFPAHVAFLTFFTNVMLLACFLGMSLGCLAARRRRDYLAWTPYLLFAALAAGLAMDALHPLIYEKVAVGNPDSPQLIFFGTESRGEARPVIPIEAVSGLFFLLVTLTLVGPGQELGRCLERLENRVQAYTINILGSLTGIVLFAALSFLQLSPFWWFAPVAGVLAYFLVRQPAAGFLARGLSLAGVVVLSSLTSLSRYQEGQLVQEEFWSPYYRVTYVPSARQINVNLISDHQRMVALDFKTLDGRHPVAWALPYLLNQHAGNRPIEDVLIVGAGSGSDVARALQWNVRRVDAVEIDPVIQALGAHHPDRPYADERVVVHINDGRNFIRSTDRQYDLVLFAIVDSLVLHSGYSNIRLESYLFTRECYADVRRRLKPGGLFVLYNYYRQGWIVDRMKRGLAEVFANEPLVLTVTQQGPIRADEPTEGVTMLLAGEPDTLAAIRATFARHGEYWLASNAPARPDSPNGFEQPPAAERARLESAGAPGWHRLSPVVVVPSAAPLAPATDDWPFLYLRQPTIPLLTLRGMLMMAAIALALLWRLAPRAEEAGPRWRFDAPMFFLGAGFMLIEAKAVVHMGLLFGSTWMVNSVVFFAILVMILAANWYVLRYRPERLGPYYLCLLAALGLNVFVPLDFFLGMSWWPQVTLSCLLVFAPILFAGVIFAVLFSRTTAADRAFGFNIAGAMAGGLAENASMIFGFRYLVLVAVLFYVLSLFGRGREPAAAAEEGLALASPEQAAVPGSSS